MELVVATKKKLCRVRQALVVLTAIISFFYAGSFFGFGPLQLMLEGDGAFSSQCDGDSPCSAQSSSLVTVQFLAAAVSQSCSPILGIMSDRFGPKALMIFLSICGCLGVSCLILSSLLKIDALLYVAFTLNGLVSMSIVIMILKTGLLYPCEQKKNRIISSLNTLYDAGMITNLGLWAIQHSLKIPYALLLGIYLMFGVFTYVGAIYCWMLLSKNDQQDSILDSAKVPDDYHDLELQIVHCDIECDENGMPNRRRITSMDSAATMNRVRLDSALSDQNRRITTLNSTLGDATNRIRLTSMDSIAGCATNRMRLDSALSAQNTLDSMPGDAKNRIRLTSRDDSTAGCAMNRIRFTSMDSAAGCAMNRRRVTTVDSAASAMNRGRLTSIESVVSARNRLASNDISVVSIFNIFELPDQKPEPTSEEEKKLSQRTEATTLFSEGSDDDDDVSEDDSENDSGHDSDSDDTSDGDISISELLNDIEAQALPKCDTSYIKIAERSRKDQFKSSQYLLIVAFFSIHFSRYQFTLTTSKDFLRYLGDDNTYQAILYLFALVALIGLPFVDYLLRVHGFHAALQTVNAIALLHGLVIVASTNLNVQIIGFFLLSMSSCLIYSVTFSFLGTFFGEAMIGNLAGMLMFVSSIVSLINIPLANMALNALGGNFFYPNLCYAFAVVPCIAIARQLGKGIRNEIL